MPKNAQLSKSVGFGVATYGLLREAFVSCGILSIFWAAQSARGQQALADAMANDSAASARDQQQQQLQNYTFKSGDFRMLVMPSLSLQWNDNVDTSGGNQEDDYIIQPTVGFLASYPLTEKNVLQLNVTAGYSEYVKHSSLSTLYLSSGSGFSFDMYIKDILVNFHDQFSYIQDSAQNAEVANTGTFGTFQNSVGTTVSWALKRIVYTLGYDHQNELTTSGELSQIDHSSESGYARAGYQWSSKLTTGFETSASYTEYADPVLNNNTSYSIGLYGDWQPDSFLHITPRAGYTVQQFDQSSLALRTSDVNSWYADLNISHDITRSLTYTLDLGHQVGLGVQSDSDQSYYARSSFIWNFIKGNRITTSVFFEHGNQGSGSSLIPGVVNPNLLSETYNWYGGEIGFSHALTSRIDLSLDYRITERTSTGTDRDYSQNLVEILLSYHPQ